MHLLTILIAVTLAIAIRQVSFHTQGWLKRWYRALFLFLFPALLLLTTALTILYMGCHGKMLGIKAGFFGCVVSGSLILFACGCLLKLAYQVDRALTQLKSYPRSKVGQTDARIIELDLPYRAQIGFWRSQLVMSQGLITTLDPENLNAVIAQEQAHVQYRDTFWFFWLDELCGNDVFDNEFTNSMDDSFDIMLCNDQHSIIPSYLLFHLFLHGNCQCPLNLVQNNYQK